VGVGAGIGVGVAVGVGVGPELGGGSLASAPSAVPGPPAMLPRSTTTIDTTRQTTIDARSCEARRWADVSGTAPSSAMEGEDDTPTDDRAMTQPDYDGRTTTANPTTL
jgi:hypothetical protein